MRIAFIVACFTERAEVKLILIIYFGHFTLFMGMYYTKVGRTGSFNVCKCVKVFNVVTFAYDVRKKWNM
jgi:hypothetical protein